ncbi:hypothetical protein EPR50_G00085410 [Perca flavescens]|uniref:TRIM8/14/16/25/29/45/65 coiled-coil region domain-containing protein n=1 Tax=Perca flavescens TaxID=8167 RepID=A0A484D1V4_PERFV|nr:hypothetical protein EPR50_G00085410 [Perca flavescens]
MQRRLEGTKQEIANRVLDSERKMAELREAADSIRACDDIERLCAESIRLFVRSVERKRSEMSEKVGEAEKSGVGWTNSRLGQVQREVLELRRREDELDQLSLTEDPIQFLQGCRALGDLPVFTDSHARPDMLTEFVTAQTDKLKNMCNKEKRELFSHSEEDLLSKKPTLCEETTSRTYLLTKYKSMHDVKKKSLECSEVQNKS